jgi:hypothetical protein
LIIRALLKKQKSQTILIIGLIVAIIGVGVNIINSPYIQPYIESYLQPHNCLTVEVKKHNFSPAADSAEIILITSLKPDQINISAGQNWVKASIRNNVLVIKVLENDTETKRITDIIVSASKCKDTIRIEQNNHHLTVEKEELTFESSEASADIALNTSLKPEQIKVNISPDNQDWVTASIRNNILIISVSANNSKTKRDAIITVSGLNCKEKINVEQLNPKKIETKIGNEQIPTNSIEEELKKKLKKTADDALY